MWYLIVSIPDLCTLTYLCFQIQERLQNAGIDVSELEIKSNWQLLKSMGCADDHILFYPNILCERPQKLKFYEKQVKRIGCSDMSVALLNMAKLKNRFRFKCKV